MLGIRHKMFVLHCAFCASCKLDLSVVQCKVYMVFLWVVNNLFLIQLPVSLFVWICLICLDLPSSELLSIYFGSSFRNPAFLWAIDFFLDGELSFWFSEPIFHFGFLQIHWCHWCCASSADSPWPRCEVFFHHRSSQYLWGWTKSTRNLRLLLPRLWFTPSWQNEVLFLGTGSARKRSRVAAWARCQPPGDALGLCLSAGSSHGVAGPVPPEPGEQRQHVEHGIWPGIFNADNWFRLRGRSWWLYELRSSTS